jgi:hypothetical protein
MAAAIARHTPVRFCALPTERQARCHHFHGETNSLSLRAESILFFILVAILAPAPVARNQTALDNRLRQAATSCTLPALRAPICQETWQCALFVDAVSLEGFAFLRCLASITRDDCHGRDASFESSFLVEKIMAHIRLPIGTLFSFPGLTLT